MENYIVIKSFFKLSDQKDYIIGDNIELSKEDAERFLKNGLVEKPKAVKAKK
jgi:hypothetical protein